VKISFCLTTYNKKELLEITLQNYFENKKPNYELIISDGCSTDGTIEFLKELKEKGQIDTLILSDKRDNGEWEGFKKTLDYVTGDYFYFLSDDDYFNFDAIDRILTHLEKNSNIDYLIADGVDLKLERNIEHLNYHAIFKAVHSMNPNKNGLKDGTCGLGLFIKSALISKLELFTPLYGKRVDKGITLTLMNSPYIGASTNILTYVGIKNEKSNSYIYNYNYAYLEKQETLTLDIKKDFLANVSKFSLKFDEAKSMINNQEEEFLTYYNRTD
jgi:glycosyltransferase involved in cell wall biosynthesis